MSDVKRASSSKTISTNSALNNSNLKLRQVASAKITFNSNAHADPLLSKEEEYRRLNEELERKTAALVRDAEEALKANEYLINEADQLSKISDINFLTNEAIGSDNATSSKPPRKEKSNLFDVNDLAKFKQTIDNLEGDENQNDEEAYNDNLDDVDTKTNMLIPKSANEMSNEAQIRFLKAKLKVMQEELERYQFDLNKKEEENLKLAQRCKDLDEDRAKQLRISNSHQTQMDKYKKLNEEAQAKLSAQELQLQAVKKENDQLKKDFKKQQVDQQQVDLRLNRALEEIEKYKQQLAKTQHSSKDLNEQEKRRIEQLQSDNKRLQKQKLELIQAFKKQLKLIDILKKQKMHLEAAKMLQFSEEEFINALEWNSNNGPSAQASVPKPPGGGASNKANLGNRPPSGSTNRSNRNNVTNASNNKQPLTQQQNKLDQKLFADESKNDFNNNYDEEDDDDDQFNNENVYLNEKGVEQEQQNDYDYDYETPMYNNVELDDDDEEK